ncbi:MAG: hypothetical protein RLZZ628_589 [Bacteroidota bacterium]|jgi:hypothetical protein
MKIIQSILIFSALSLAVIKCYLWLYSIFPLEIFYMLWIFFITICIGLSRKPLFTIITLLIAILGILELTVIKDMKASNPSVFEIFYPLYILLYDEVDYLKNTSTLFNDTLMSFLYYISMIMFVTYRFIQQKYYEHS